MILILRRDKVDKDRVMIYAELQVKKLWGGTRAVPLHIATMHIDEVADVFDLTQLVYRIDAEDAVRIEADFAYEKE